MEGSYIFQPEKRNKVIISRDLREALSTHDTTIIQQRIFFVILSALKDKQSLFVPEKNNLEKENKQLSFDDQFDGWANEGVIHFQIPIKEINIIRSNDHGRKLKMRNEVIHETLTELANIKSFRLRDETINGYQGVFLILNPKWNSRNVFFSIDKAVARILFDLKPFYFQVKSNLPYQASTPNSLRFLLFLLKYRRAGLVKRSFEKLLRELNIPLRKYQYASIFERDFLRSVKADLDAFNDVSFNYSYNKVEFEIRMYKTEISETKTNGISEELNLNDEIKIIRALKYLQKTRALDERNLRTMNKLYRVKGYDQLATKIKRKIDKNIKGDDFVKAIFELLEKL